MAFDIELIAAVRNLTSVSAICVGKKIYHWEVLQSQGFSSYPCIAYNLTSDAPFRELGGVSGLRIASFTFQSYSKLSDDIRALSGAIQSMGTDPAGLITLQGWTAIQWIYVDDTSDDFEPCVDLDEKGMKASEQTVTVVYKG